MSELGRLSLPTLKLVGIEDTFIANHTGGPADNTIGELWGALMACIPELGVPMNWMIGVTGPTMSGVPFEMRYFAGLVVEELPADLHGLKAYELAGATYATYEHHGSMQTVGDSVSKFYAELLPQSGLQVALGPHLEVYDERFTMDDSSVFRFAAPIVV